MESVMPKISCPKCNYELLPNETPESGTVPCPSCGESVEIPAKPLVPPPKNQGGGVFVMAAVLLIAVVIAVVFFWGGLLKKREVPRHAKPEEKKQGQIRVLWAPRG
jgi:hypothetical protein